ncbi:peptidylprolyl isomerase [Geomesophilobacter sediminis]|uniref:Peptidyl-prolyl cis-trans isomerase n=1 Tax=Geomesophilobacter sediminis TaxID=2798584 RepID=A0A8J7J855_9BACT|nr:peptidylprolyl isomerase [Geomesophilobacter sediminis]MBJ6725696.1 peptidyl-prolyl cis-trans isomerase [Geomesophilobacter sediminis]
MFRKMLLALVVVVSLCGSAFAAGKNPTAVIDTNQGKITIELFANQAPLSVANFIDYAKSGFYEGTIFHRVIQGFMIQGGGMTASITPKQTGRPIKNEAGNGLKNDRGTVAMARTGVVDSATAQFYINVVNNPFLNHRDNSQQGFGYAVFGKVISGMDVVDKIAATPTGVQQGMPDVPLTPVVIKSVTIHK